MALQIQMTDVLGQAKMLVCDAVNIEAGFVECEWKLRDGTSHIRSFLTTEPIKVRRLYSGLRDVVGKPDAILET